MLIVVQLLMGHMLKRWRSIPGLGKKKMSHNMSGSTIQRITWFKYEKKNRKWKFIDLF